jgi:hypothetical protein
MASTSNAVRHFILSVDKILIMMRDSQMKDLEVILKLGSCRWKWEAMSAGRMAADILSRHLIMPMITLNEFALKSPQPPNTMDDNTWTKVIGKLHNDIRCSKKFQKAT